MLFAVCARLKLLHDADLGIPKRKELLALHGAAVDEVEENVELNILDLERFQLSLQQHT